MSFDTSSIATLLIIVVSTSLVVSLSTVIGLMYGVKRAIREANRSK